MEFTIANILLTFGAGLASVLSPCVLPVAPIIVTGTEEDSKYRPILIVGGLAITFVLMGLISSLAGSLIAGKMLFLEKFSGVVILLFGLLMLFNVNLFKKITFFNRFNRGARKRGGVEGLILGLTLGLIWIPCVGPMLSSVLATVATAGHAGTGVTLLLIYSGGFAVPMLLAAYSTQFFRRRISSLQANPLILRGINGGVLILFGIYILVKGVINFGY